MKKPVAKVVVAMARDKKLAEHEVTGQADDLFYHSLKFLIHVSSFDGEYTYWQKDSVSTIIQLQNSALNVSTKSGVLKKDKVVALLQFNWTQPRKLIQGIRNVYDDPKLLKLLKRYLLVVDFYASLDLTVLDSVLSNFVDRLYEEHYSAYELANFYFNELRSISK